MRRCSDKRLAQLVRQALLALEDPAGGMLLDDFDLRYRERERKREQDDARWFYRDKTPFETKYDEDCGRDPCNEPAWVSDLGRGAAASAGIVSYALDGDEDRTDDPKRRSGLSVTWSMKREAALRRVRRNLPHALKTFKLILKNRDNRRESIGALAKSQSPSRTSGRMELARRKYRRDLDDLTRLFTGKSVTTRYSSK